MHPAIAAFVVLAIVGAPIANAQTKPAVPAKAGSAAAAAKAGVPAAAAIASPLKPGLWEIVLLNETPGSTARRSVTARACHSADDVKSLQQVLPRQQEFGMQCTTRDLKLNGANATWRVDCSGKEGSLSGPAKLTLAGDSYTGSADLQRVAGGKPSKVQQTITGKWISACK